MHRIKDKMLWSVIVNLLLPAICRRSGPVVPHRDIQTTQGLVRGYLVKSNYYAYLGIPYAKTSARDRFQAPKLPRRWDSIFEATHHVKCPQSDGSGVENCLVLNVFTPVEGASLPVLVYVHGGEFQNGWGPTVPMKLLLQKNIIILTFNFRIGALGFLCLNVPEIPGNAGLKDHIAVLYWIHRNIFNFGGNPLDVTIYGVESGAVLIQLLLLSQSTEGLFQKVILEAGSVLSPMSITYDPVNLAFNAAKSLGYDGDENNKQLTEFFLKITLKELTNTAEYFLPCIETESYKSHSVVDFNPTENLEQGNFQMLPMIIIYTGKIFEINTQTVNNFENLLPSNLDFPDNEIKNKVAELVKGFYFEESDDYKKRFTNYMNDVLIHYPTIKMATLFALKTKQPVFLMKYLYEANTASFFNGANFNNAIAGLLYSDIDENKWIKERIVTLLSNFINIGDPTPLITESIPIVWQPITSTAGRLEMNFIPQLIFDRSMKLENAATQQILFWNSIYTRFYKVHNSYYNGSDYKEI